MANARNPSHRDPLFLYSGTSACGATFSKENGAQRCAGSPTLIDVTRNGRKIPAVAQIARHGLLFILDRATRKPLYNVEERPIPKSDVPGEYSWPTQPFPVRPSPLALVAVA